MFNILLRVFFLFRTKKYLWTLALACGTYKPGSEALSIAVCGHVVRAVRGQRRTTLDKTKHSRSPQ